MSFAYDVKAELCKVPINRSCCASSFNSLKLK